MRKKAVLLLVFIVFILSACAPTMNNISPEAKPYAVYLQAVNVFNSNIRTYLDTKKMMPPEVQAEWKEEIEPFIKIAKEALDDWGVLTMDGLPDAVAHGEYDKLFSQMLALMIKYKIVEVK